MERNFSLPNLFRSIFNESQSSGRKNVFVTIPEDDKDAFIYAMQDTRFVAEGQTHRFPVPSTFSIDDTVISIDAGNIEEGTMIIGYH